jgi:hypothetical protein
LAISKLILFSKNVKNQSEQDAQNDAGCQWEVKGEVAALDPYIPREMPQMEKRKEVRVVQQYAGDKQDDTEDNQDTPQTHIVILVDRNGSKYPPAKPEALRLLAPQRDLIATDETAF